MKAVLDKYGARYGSPAGLLLLRLGFGFFMVVNHGYPKLASYAEKAEKFADPLGVSPPVSLALAIFGELVCGALLVVGLGTRVAALPAVFTMLVAAFVQHSDSPFNKGEHALLFAVAFAAIALLGAGPWSLDGLIARKRTAG